MEFRELVEEEIVRVLIEQSRTYDAGEVRRKIDHILDRFDLPADAHELLQTLRNKLGRDGEISRQEIDQILKLPSVRRKAANVDYHDFVTWVLER